MLTGKKIVLPRVWRQQWRSHRTRFGKAEVLARESVMVVEQANNRPALEAALMVIVSAAGRGVLRFP